MRLIILGTGAGGGCPQWNCGCDNCDFARRHPERARTTDSLAVSYVENGKTAWAIINPGTDLRHQLARHSEFSPQRGAIRGTPIKTVILTDGELDHTMGLVNLREGSQLKIFATGAVLELLEKSFPIKQVLQNYARLEFCRIEAGKPFCLGDGGIEVTPFGLGDKQPKYAVTDELAKSSDAMSIFEVDTSEKEEAVIGLRFESNDPDYGAVAYAPQIGKWDENIEHLLDGAETILIDGTFYTSDELSHLGVTACSAESMGHLPLSGPNGILARLTNVKARVKLLTHINNSNPILRDNSTERLAVENYGVRIAEDGMVVHSTKKVEELLS